MKLFANKNHIYLSFQLYKKNGIHSCVFPQRYSFCRDVLFFCRDNCGPPHILFSKKQRIKTRRFHTCEKRFFFFFSDGTVTNPAI